MAVEFKVSGTVLFKTSGTVAMDANCCCISNGCCSGVAPILTATFGGTLAALGSITLTYDSGTGYWQKLNHSTAECGETGDGFDLQFYCVEAPPGTFNWTFSVVGSDTTAVNWIQDSLTCNPFDWDATDTAVGGTTCNGTGTVSITE